MTKFIFIIALCFLALDHCAAQGTEWLLYTRTIRDSKGNFRFDQNIVPNIKINELLRLELGIRHGENTNASDAYYHYKVELQTKWFWKSLRFVTRLSDNIVKSPTVYSKSNYLAIAESRFNLTPHVRLLLGAGTVFSSQRDGVKDAAPSFGGSRRVYPTYRASLRYLFSERWFASAVYGAYDTFNPYLVTSPFVQVDSEYELTHHVTLYGYFRYQFDHHLNEPLNDFLGLGVRLRR